MTASTTFKGLLASAAAVALVGTALAQGTPPAPAATDPAVGAGQQSSQQTPMGSTGTPGGGATGATAGSTTGSGAMASDSGSTGSTGSGSMGSTGGSMGAMGTGSSGSTAPARADRG